MLYIIIAIVTLDFLLDQVLDYINLKNHKETLPAELQGIYDEEKYRKSVQYHKANASFSFITSTISFIVLIVLLLKGAFGTLDALLRNEFQNPIILSLAFFGALFLASDILSMPFSVYRTFVIEEKFGFNKTSPATFLIDKIKGYILTIIVGGGILSILLWLIINLGQDFWLWFWLVISIFILFINMFYTSLIVPLFNKLKPMEQGELKEAIEAYSRKVSFPLDNIFVIDGSKRSTKANAFFSGIGGKKKIVLYDTLIQNHSKEELVAVLAHEVGHFKKKHIITGFILSIVQTGIMLFILSRFVFNPSLSYALGGTENAIHLNLIAFGILFTPISHIIGIVMNIISRKNEYEADAYAASTYSSEPLQIALKKLSVNNLSNLTPHPAYVFFHYSHPPLLQRLRALRSR